MPVWHKRFQGVCVLASTCASTCVATQSSSQGALAPLYTCSLFVWKTWVGAWCSTRFNRWRKSPHHPMNEHVLPVNTIAAPLSPTTARNTSILQYLYEKRNYPGYQNLGLQATFMGPARAGSG
jgi:hypothetical protein